MILAHMYPILYEPLLIIQGIVVYFDITIMIIKMKALLIEKYEVIVRAEFKVDFANAETAIFKW